MISIKPLARHKDPLLQPLLSSDEVLYYMNRGLSYATSAHSTRQSAQGRSGTHASAFRGSGLDYDESRAYQPGDELRNINWRLMARTSQLFTKVYQEEREASVMLVIDRRATMRFGTRKHLKVTRAVQIACYLAGLSLQQGYSAGVSLLQPDSLRMPPQRSQARVRDCLASAASACPPLVIEADEVKLAKILTHLQLSTTAGNRLILISDFHDLEETDRVVLAQLAAQHQLQAIQVLDPLEESLPAGGTWLIDDYADARPVKVNANDSAMQNSYREEMRRRQALIQSLFSQCQIPFTSVHTDDSFDSSLRQMGYA